MMDALRNALKNMVRRVKITRVDGPGGVQVQGLGEQPLEAERFLPWGLSSRPRAGKQALVVLVGGAQSAPVVLGEAAKNAPALAQGEVMIYAEGGASVHLKNNGDVLVKPGSGGKVEMGGEGLPASAGVVTGACQCVFSGGPHPQASQMVFAKKEA